MLEIFLDIETIPTQRADIQARMVSGISPPGQYKKPESIAQWWAAEGEAKRAEAIHSTALNGTWGELICIGVAVNDHPAEVFTRALTEADLFSTFGLMLDAKCKRLSGSCEMWPITATWIGHNIIDFDLRFLWQRSKLLGVRLPFKLPVDKYSKHVYDTMREWCAYGRNVSQKDLELAFGIPRMDPLKEGGADVWEAYKAGQIDHIREHCRVDVENLRQIYRRMTA
jgi:hypothetical protein